MLPARCLGQDCCRPPKLPRCFALWHTSLSLHQQLSGDLPEPQLRFRGYLKGRKALIPLVSIAAGALGLKGHEIAAAHSAGRLGQGSLASLPQAAHERAEPAQAGAAERSLGYCGSRGSRGPSTRPRFLLGGLGRAASTSCVAVCMSSSSSASCCITNWKLNQRTCRADRGRQRTIKGHAEGDAHLAGLDGDLWAVSHHDCGLCQPCSSAHAGPSSFIIKLSCCPPQDTANGCASP